MKIYSCGPEFGCTLLLDIVGVEWIEMRTSFCGSRPCWFLLWWLAIAVARNPGNMRRPHPETS